MSLLRSEVIRHGASTVVADQHANGTVTLTAYGTLASTTIHIRTVDMPALIAFLQSCTPAAPAEGAR